MQNCNGSLLNTLSIGLKNPNACKLAALVVASQLKCIVIYIISISNYNKPFPIYSMRLLPETCNLQHLMVSTIHSVQLFFQNGTCFWTRVDLDRNIWVHLENTIFSIISHNPKQRFKVGMLPPTSIRKFLQAVIRFP